MRKFKNLFGILMLCAVLVGCDLARIIDEEIPPGTWRDDVRLEFTRIELHEEPGFQFFINDGHGNATHNWLFPAMFPLPTFMHVFWVPATFSGNHRPSQITATTTHLTGGSEFHRYNSDTDRGLWSSSMLINLYHDGNNNNFMAQTLSIEIISGLYRRNDGVAGTLPWVWDRLASSFARDQVTILPQQMIVHAGPFQHTSMRFAPMTIISDGFESPFGNNNQTFNPGQIPRPPSTFVVDERITNAVLTPDYRVLEIFNKEDSRLTAIELADRTEVSLHETGMIAVEAIMLGQNEGVLKVYATEETVRNLGLGAMVIR